MKPRRAIDEATGILVFLVVLLIACAFIVPPFAVICGGAILFVLYFFRDPERIAPNDPGIAVAPADGRIVAIADRAEGEAGMGRMVCVSIFLSVFDVHVNRSPIAGRVTHSEGRQGIYLDARDPECARRNASRLWIIESPQVTVLVRQITGAIARRIVPWSAVGDELAQGEKFGMIRFGSRTELWVPEGSKILVRVGESVRGGVTPLVQFDVSTEPRGDAIGRREPGPA
ncbi:MAG: phosphatidylserine decarboxylase [Terrimicrobiaceae bacterium]|nr:phosphatidylserine decarboxylase [Terrimicrobiaceae bacterium]